MLQKTLGLGVRGVVLAPLCRYIEKESNAKNEHLRRLEQTTLEDLRKELVLVRRGGFFWQEWVLAVSGLRQSAQGLLEAASFQPGTCGHRGTGWCKGASAMDSASRDLPPWR